MLAHYKVDPCKVAGRHNMVLCPYYHSAKERRRSIATHKYRYELIEGLTYVKKCDSSLNIDLASLLRAVACAMVKDKDEWLEPSSCDAGDSCCYSHTRMELQYHPDVGSKLLWCNWVAQLVSTAFMWLWTIGFERRVGAIIKIMISTITQVFRTVACTKEQKSGQCNKRMFCAFAHDSPSSGCLVVMNI